MSTQELEQLCQQLEEASPKHDISSEVQANGARTMVKVIQRFQERVEPDATVSDEDKETLRQHLINVSGLLLRSLDRSPHDYGKSTDLDLEIFTQSFAMTDGPEADKVAAAMKGPAAGFWLSPEAKAVIAKMDEMRGAFMNPDLSQQLIMETNFKGIVADASMVPIPRSSKWVIREPEEGSAVVEESKVRTQDMVNCLVIRPKEVKQGNAILYYVHGGGFVFLSPGIYASFLAEVSAELGIVVVAPDYRKAPVHRFPAGLQDVLDAYSFLTSEQESVKAMVKSLTKVERVDKVVTGGDSAGGNLCAGLTFALSMMRSAGATVQMPAGIHMIYPCFTPAPIAFPSTMIQNVDLLITPGGMSMMMCLYPTTETAVDISAGFGEAKASIGVLNLVAKYTADPLFNSLAWSDWRALAHIPLVTFVCEFDPLMDMGLAFAGKWEGAKRVRVGRDMVHGQMLMAASPDLMAEVVRDLSAMLTGSL